MSVSLAAAVVAVLAAAPIALMAVRHSSPLSRVLERLSYLGYALPGIVVALALVALGARGAPWLYQTRGILLVAYINRFLPQALCEPR